MDENVRLTAMMSAYERSAIAISQAFTAAHAGEGSVDDLRKRFLSPPVTTSEAAWQLAYSERADKMVVAYLVESVTDTGVTVRVDRRSLRSVTDEQLVVGALYHRLHHPCVAFARSANPNARVPDFRAAYSAERARLLGLANPAWGEPLGQLAITERAPFDEVDSLAGLAEAHNQLLERVVAALPAVARDRVATALTPPWTSDEDQLRNGSKGYLVEGFSPHSWEFDCAWLDRSEMVAAGRSTEQLLWDCCETTLLGLAHAGQLPIDDLFRAAAPEWYDGYAPTKMSDRSLRLT